MRRDQRLGVTLRRSRRRGEQVRDGSPQAADGRHRTSRPPLPGGLCLEAGSAIARLRLRPRYNTAPEHRRRFEMDQSIIEGMPGRYWHPLEDGRIQCDLCPRYCKLHEGQRGLCFVRGRGTTRWCSPLWPLVRLLHRSDREEAAQPLSPGTPVLSFGTAGCNLTCKFCQNWDISKRARSIAFRTWPRPRRSPKRRCERLPLGRVHLQRSGDLPRICGRRGAGLPRARHQDGGGERRLHCAEPRIEFFRHMDAANIDLKGFTEGFYKSLCSGQLAPVLETAGVSQARDRCLV